MFNEKYNREIRFKRGEKVIGLKRFLSAMLFILISTLVACGNKVDISTPLTEEQKIEDFNYLYKTIEENYPF